MKFAAEVAHLDTPSTDGRLISNGALVFQLPVRVTYRHPDAGAMVSVGAVDEVTFTANVVSVSGLIRAEYAGLVAELVADGPVYGELGLSSYNMDESPVEGEWFRVSFGRVGYVFLGRDPAWENLGPLVVTK